jgi:hypothetical protein
MPPIRREIFLDHGRVYVECPRLMSDAELAVVLKAFVAEIEARPLKPSISVERPNWHIDLASFAGLLPLHELKLRPLRLSSLLPWVRSSPQPPAQLVTPTDYPDAHAHVLGALLGRGDPDLTGEVETPLAPSRVMFAGLDTWLQVEDEVIQELGLHHAGAATLAETSSPVLDWITDQHIKHLAIHFDLDVLDPSAFRPLTFNKPGLPPGAFSGVARGRMLPDEVVRLLRDVAGACDVVGRSHHVGV